MKILMAITLVVRLVGLVLEALILAIESGVFRR
jgi:hypothetical protein